jgi:hypothetical protein
MKNILGIIANPRAALIGAVVKLLKKQFNLDKLPGIFKYVDEDNELDVGLRRMQEQHDALKEIVIEMAKEPFEERIKDLEAFQKKMKNFKSVKRLLSRE